MCSAFAKEFGKAVNLLNKQVIQNYFCNLLLTKNPREFYFPNILTQILLA